jgi:hypothetical protein
MAHQYDEEVAMTHLIETVQAGVDIPYEYLGEIASKAGIDAKTSETLGRKRLAPYGTEMLSWTYRQIVENCRKRGVLPVWVFMPTLELSMSEEKVATLNQLADEAGFIVLDLGDYYGNQDIKSLWVEEWDNHPNAKAHELLANRLYEVLLEQSERIPLGLQAGTGSP